ncbi:TPA: diphthine--ammonia ligase [Desulfurococcaceae archaeon]|nr:diphthine--ammonia ligase [Desulfurococcaceae archaeon]
MKAAVLTSGGKDSNYAAHWAALHGFEICCLLTLKPPEDSELLQFSAVETVGLQAKAMGVEWIFEEGEEGAVRDLMVAARERGASYLVSGALLSDYQRQRLGYFAKEAGLVPVNPLWRVDQEKYMRMLIRHGFEFILVRVAAEGLGPEFLGRVITAEDVEEIIRRARRYGFNPAFEGGEAETLVLRAPLYKKKIYVEGEVVKRGPGDWVYVIRRAELRDL